MKSLSMKQYLVISMFGLIGWALCGTIMFVGMAVTDMQTTLILHLMGAPIIFTIISLVYFKKFNYTSPLQTATMFLTLVLLLDFFLVAIIINKSLDMFSNPIGTWVPFVFIFLSTYRTGTIIRPTPPQVNG